MPTKIIDSFSQSLPSYDNPNLPGSVAVTASGQSTISSDAPKFAIAIPVGTYVSIGKEAVQKTPTKNRLGQGCLSDRDETIRHISEADVARSSALYLIDPVNKAFAAVSEFAHKIQCMSEYGIQTAVRGDLVYCKTTPSHPKKGRPFAVIEYKKRGAIDPSQFDHARKIVDDTHTQQHWVERAAVSDPEDLTFFTGNAKTMMKQAVSYATKLGTQHVVLFDWNYMVLVRFTELKLDLPKKELVKQGAGVKCEMSRIGCSQKSEVARSALLGFLMEAYRQTPSD